MHARDEVSRNRVLQKCTKAGLFKFQEGTFFDTALGKEGRPTPGFFHKTQCNSETDSQDFIKLSDLSSSRTRTREDARCYVTVAV